MHDHGASATTSPSSRPRWRVTTGVAYTWYQVLNDGRSTPARSICVHHRFDLRGRPNCDAHSPANRFEPCNNSTTCAEYSLKGTVATACLALLEGDCLSVPMFTYPCSVSGRRLHSRRPPCHLTPRTVREKHGEDTGRQWMQRSQRWWWKRDKRRDGEATRREDSRQCLWFFMVLFGFLWFFSRLIFSSHRWGMMKISFP